MRITILAAGTTGDVQPFLALAEALQKHGHTVCLAVPYFYENRVRSKNLTYSPMRMDVEAIFQGELGRQIAQWERNPIQRIRLILREGHKLVGTLADDVWQACQGAEVIVSVNLIGYVVQSVAEYLQIPIIEASVMPSYPSRELKHALFPVQMHLGGWFNRLTSLLIDRALWTAMRGQVKKLRAQLGMPPQNFRQYIAARDQYHYIHCYSEHVLPRPSDWSPRVHTTGYWFDRAPVDYVPPMDLQAFLQAGEPPIYIGFGSAMTKDPLQQAQLIVAAIQKTQQRAIVAENWGGLRLEHAPAEIFVLRQFVPHTWLFDHVKAIIHHGGAGTTGVSLRSGRPSAIIPHTNDQFAWSDQLYRDGVIPLPIVPKKLTVANLTDMIHQLVNNADLRQKSAELGKRLRAEDGLSNAIQIIERVAAQTRISHSQQTD